MKTANDFREIAAEYMGQIQLLYSRFADKKPIIELVLPSRKIYAYPFLDYMKTLSKRSQELLKKEYHTAIRANKMIVFIRDNEERILKSASFPIESIEYVRSEVHYFIEDDT